MPDKVKIIMQEVDLSTLSGVREKSLNKLEKKVEEYIKTLGVGAEFEVQQSSAQSRGDFFITFSIIHKNSNI